MADFWYQDLGHGITCIDTGYGRPMLAACYMLEANDQLAFVDCGTSYTVERALKVMHEKGYTAEQVRYVIPTHVHLDHAGGAGAMIEAFPNAQLVIHPRGARHMIDPSKLIAGVKAVYGEAGYQKHFGKLVQVPADRVIEAADGFALDMNGRVLNFIDTPGHARHHFCVHDVLSGGIFTGDTFGLSYREFDTDNGPFIFATTTPVQFDPQAWYQTLDRLMALKPRNFYLTHFSSIPATADLEQRLRQSIAVFVDIANTASANAANASGDNPGEEIMQKMEEKLMNELRAHGCQLSDSRCRELLKGDVDLNTQGLVFWLKNK